MKLVIRHYPDRKNPCLVLEQDNMGVVIGHLSKKGEKWLKQAFDCPEDKTIEIICRNDVFKLESEE